MTDTLLLPPARRARNVPIAALPLRVARVIGIELRLARSDPGLLRVDERRVLVLLIGALPVSMLAHETHPGCGFMPEERLTAHRVPRDCARRVNASRAPLRGSPSKPYQDASRLCDGGLRSIWRARQWGVRDRDGLFPRASPQYGRSRLHR